jgi:hypothetical protein
MNQMIPEDRQDVASAVRRYLAVNPSADDGEIAAFLGRERLHASPALLQQVRWEMAQRSGKPAAGS